MRGLYRQIADSYRFCYDNFPKFENPVEMWRYVKPLLTFRHDPSKGDVNQVTGKVYTEETELIQSAQTLFDNNIHGESGYGDCDCFSALAIAIFHTQGWNDCDIVLAGRDKKDAVHIYTYVTFEGETYCVDFTQPRFNSERYYPYTQVIPVTFKSIDMARLQLAEPNYMSLSEGVADLYIVVPDGKGGTMKVKEDFFDDWGDLEYKTFMDLVEPYNTPMHMNGILSKWRERQQQKREDRRAFKLQKQQDKFAGRENVAKAGGGLGGIIGKVTEIFGGGAQDEMLPPTQMAPAQRDFSLQVGQNIPNMPGSFWANNKQWIIPAGIGVAVLGGAWLYSRSRK
jgi:hypothetical protein